MQLKKTYHRLSLGLENIKDVIFKIYIYIKSFIFRKNPVENYEKYLQKKIINDRIVDGVLVYKDIVLPDIRSDKDCLRSFLATYYDILFFYDKRNNCFKEKVVDVYEKYFAVEGTYCYQDGDTNIMISPGDIVIDAGSFIGAFSAYASSRGAFTYAFEPSKNNIFWLKKTASLNKNIEPIPMALYSSSEKISFEENSIGSQIKSKNLDNGDSREVQAISLDDFVKKEGIKKINFIKADIEGAEREMLKGATWVLNNFSPILSICTYHLKDDPEVLSKIIKQANPKYKIIQRKMKLYAYV